MLDLKTVLSDLKSRRNQHNIDGMARFGINPRKTLGVSMVVLRKLARKIRLESKSEDQRVDRRHDLALKLWSTGIHEARILASLIAEPQNVSSAEMEKWVKDLDSWDVCDQACMNLWRLAPFAWIKARAWAKRRETFVKRAGFVLMATLAVHDKKASDRDFIRLLPVIQSASMDERNFVRKSVNWALRQIGKRNGVLNIKALRTARQILKINTCSARWIAVDAIRELELWDQKKKN